MESPTLLDLTENQPDSKPAQTSPPVPKPPKPLHLQSKTISRSNSVAEPKIEALINPFEVIDVNVSTPLIMEDPSDYSHDSDTSIESPAKVENPFQEVAASSPVLPPRLPPRPLVTESPRRSIPQRSSTTGSIFNRHVDRQESGLMSPLYQPPPVLLERPLTTFSFDYDERYSAIRGSRETYHAPDFSNVYRSAPVADYLPTTEFFHKSQSNCLCYCGFYCVTGNSNARIWYIPSAENRLTIPHNEAKMLAMAFVNCLDLENEGKFIWISLDRGELIEYDTLTGQKGAKSNSHTAPVTLILKSKTSMYTIDENGCLKIWSPDSSGRISLTSRPRSLRIQSKILHACIVDQTIWTAQAKMIEVYSLDENVPNLLLKRHDVPHGISNISCITFVPGPRIILTGHECGKVTVYSADTLEKLIVVQVSSYKILSILGIKNYVWVGFQTGKINIFEIQNENWIAILDFLAYANSGVSQLLLDECAQTGTTIYSSVMSFSENGHGRLWDGLLLRHKIDVALKLRVDEYSIYRPLKVNIVSYNIDSRKPSDMDASREDREILKQYLDTNEADLHVFGFQELVDLENKSVSAKSFLQGPKKSAAALDSKLDQRLRLWKERLNNMFPTTYKVVEANQLVGLFQCIIAKNSLVLSDSSVKFVKTGLGGLHGNKGAISTRFMIEDSSFCFINCHLAAHQSHVSARNNDIQQIMKDTQFTPLDAFWERGGDGKMISDYEYTFWNGDMNYRIDMTRDEVIAATKTESWSLLWENDQLLKQRNTNNSFGLRGFVEAPLNFAPTFKYNRGTDQFDSSDKQRIPAYCDRIMSRGPNVIQHSYERLNIKMSDHRPVGATFTVNVKTVNRQIYENIKDEVHNQLKLEQHRDVENVCINWLMLTRGFNFTQAREHLRSFNGSMKDASHLQ